METLIQTVVNGLAIGGTYALLAIGLAMVFSVLGLVNFAHGELLTVAGYTMFGLTQAGLPFWVAAAAGIVTAAAAAIVMERVAFRPLRGASLETLLLSSLAVGTILQVLFAQFISPRTRSISTPEFFARQVELGPISIGGLQLIAIAVVVALLVLLSLFMQRTMLGRSIRAAGVDFETARLVGIRANSMYLLAFGMSGALAGVAAILWVGQRGAVDPVMGLTPVIAAFLATVIGGLGSLSGAAIGGLIYGLVQVVFEQYLPGAIQPYREALVLSVLVAILIKFPYGLLTRGGIDSVRRV
ncbi:branched-chain amino acid ABC transporter permease [Micromonospora sp. NPDC048830]|uniref:branched-chain amino acid ABC transporter permease n=1 Tax=Micromonospora sp. NPDC048830 TaxID=3364257 RepID=UPI00371DBDDD